MAAAATRRRKNPRAELADALRRLRVQHGLSQQDAAVRAGLHARYWQKLEAAEANPTIDSIGLICHAFDVSFAELLAPPDEAHS